MNYWKISGKWHLLEKVLLRSGSTNEVRQDPIFHFLQIEGSNASVDAVLQERLKANQGVITSLLGGWLPNAWSPALEPCVHGCSNSRQTDAKKRNVRRLYFSLQIMMHWATTGWGIWPQAAAGPSNSKPLTITSRKSIWEMKRTLTPLVIQNAGTRSFEDPNIHLDDSPSHTGTTTLHLTHAPCDANIWGGPSLYMSHYFDWRLHV